jgi:hypothetical protein
MNQKPIQIDINSLLIPPTVLMGIAEFVPRYLALKGWIEDDLLQGGKSVVVKRGRRNFETPGVKLPDCQLIRLTDRERDLKLIEYDNLAVEDARVGSFYSWRSGSLLRVSRRIAVDKLEGENMELLNGATFVVRRGGQVRLKNLHGKGQIIVRKGATAVIEAVTDGIEIKRRVNVTLVQRSSQQMRQISEVQKGPLPRAVVGLLKGAIHKTRIHKR